MKYLPNNGMYEETKKLRDSRNGIFNAINFHGEPLDEVFRDDIYTLTAHVNIRVNSECFHAVFDCLPSNKVCTRYGY